MRPGRIGQSTPQIQTKTVVFCGKVESCGRPAPPNSLNLESRPDPEAHSPGTMLTSILSGISRAEEMLGNVIAAATDTQVAAASGPTAPTAGFGTRPLHSNLSVFIVESTLIHFFFNNSMGLHAKKPKKARSNFSAEFLTSSPSYAYLYRKK